MKQEVQVPSAREARKSRRKAAAILIGALRYVAAIDFLKAELADDPRDTRSSCLLGEAYLAEGRVDAAEKVLCDVLRRDADQPAVQMLAAQVAERRGALDAAILHLDQVAPDAREHQRARLETARLLREAKRFREALVVLRALIERDPRSLKARKMLAATLGKLGDRSGELAVREELAASDPESERFRSKAEAARRAVAAMTRAEQAEEAEAQGRAAQALQLWKAITALQPETGPPAGTPKRRKVRKPRGRAGQEEWAEFIKRAPAELVMRRIDELVRMEDLRALVLLRNAAGHGLLEDYLCFRLFAKQQCYQPALALTDRVLDGLERSVKGEARQHRREDVLALAARCAMALGRSDEAWRWLRLDPRLAASRPDAFLHVAWRSQPERGAALACEIAFGGRGSKSADVLFCALPLFAGDAERARGNLRVQETRQAALFGSVSPELLLCDAAVSVALGRTERVAPAFDAYFSRFGISQPFGTPLEADTGFFEQLRLEAAPHIRSAGPLVSVIVTAFNAASTIRYALLSLLGQTHGNLEILVVDDASSDATAAIVAAIAERDKRVKLIRAAENSGTYVSKNLALKAARGKYYTCHDADDWAHPSRMAIHVEVMEEDDSLLASRSDWVRVDDRGVPLLRRTTGVFTHPNPGSGFYRRNETLSGIGYYDRVTIDADLDHSRRFIAQFGPERIAQIALPLTLGRHHQTSLTQQGPGAMGDEYYSKVRSEYRYAGLLWRMSRLPDESLFLPCDPHRREFAAPAEIMVR